MTDDDSPDKIDWVKTAAGALAAVTTAVLLSTLGAAGTLIGAALGSIIVTVSSQLYAQGLARSKRTVAKAQETALAKVGIAQAEVRRAHRRQGETGAVEAHLEVADDRLDQARAELDEAAPPQSGNQSGSLRERFLLLPWKRIALMAAGMFLVALAVIASFEALTGRSVSSYTGGSDKDSSSTFTGVGGSSEDKGDRKNDPGKDSTQDPSTEPTPTDDGSGEPTEAPTGAPSGGTSEGTNDGSEDQPDEQPSEEPTEAPSDGATPQPREAPSEAPAKGDTAPTNPPGQPSAPAP